MGRRKKSHKLHLLQGTRKGKGKLKSLPPPVTARWNCPSWLAPEACQYHKEHFSIVESMGLLTVGDKQRWFLHCQRYARIRQYESEIDRVGALVPGRSGELKKNPLLPALKAELELFSKGCEKFGLDPESRVAMGFNLPTPSRARSKMESLID